MTTTLYLSSQCSVSYYIGLCQNYREQTPRLRLKSSGKNNHSALLISIFFKKKGMTRVIETTLIKDTVHVTITLMRGGPAEDSRPFTQFQYQLNYPSCLQKEMKHLCSYLSHGQEITIYTLQSINSLLSMYELFKQRFPIISLSPIDTSYDFVYFTIKNTHSKYEDSYPIEKK